MTSTGGMQKKQSVTSGAEPDVQLAQSYKKIYEEVQRRSAEAEDDCLELRVGSSKEDGILFL